MHKDASIGSMNGPWAILLRIALGTYPLVMAWAVWMTVNQFHDNAYRDAGPRFTPTDAQLLIADAENRVNQKLAALPPQDWRDRVAKLENSVDQLRISMAIVISNQERMLESLDKHQ
jgi:hypothetical protein